MPAAARSGPEQLRTAQPPDEINKGRLARPREQECGADEQSGYEDSFQHGHSIGSTGAPLWVDQPSFLLFPEHNGRIVPTDSHGACGGAVRLVDEQIGVVGTDNE